MRLDAINRVMVLESVEPVGVRTVPLRKYLVDYDSRGNPYPGGIVIARHRDFATLASENKLGQFGRFAVDLFGYPYDKDEIVKIAARIGASHLPFTKKYRKTLEPDREGICIPHDNSGFITPADFAKAEKVKLMAVLKPR